MAETADQAEAVKLTGFFLETADQQHLLIKPEQFILARLVARIGAMGFLQAVKGKFPIAGGSVRRCVALRGFGQWCSPWVRLRSERDIE